MSAPTLQDMLVLDREIADFLVTQDKDVYEDFVDKDEYEVDLFEVVRDYLKADDHYHDMWLVLKTVEIKLDVLGERLWALEKSVKDLTLCGCG